VLTVGGIKEKVSAAYRSGIRKIFIPRENGKDLKELPPDLLRKTKFHYLDTVDQLFEQALLNFVPSSYTLEKIFAEEMKKAKNKKKKPSTRKVAAKAKKQ
jgi:ATP-dependent Lon protease